MKSNEKYENNKRILIYLDEGKIEEKICKGCHGKFYRWISKRVGRSGMKRTRNCFNIRPKNSVTCHRNCSYKYELERKKEYLKKYLKNYNKRPEVKERKREWKKRCNLIKLKEL